MIFTFSIMRHLDGLLFSKFWTSLISAGRDISVIFDSDIFHSGACNISKGEYLSHDLDKYNSVTLISNIKANCIYIYASDSVFDFSSRIILKRRVDHVLRGRCCRRKWISLQLSNTVKFIERTCDTDLSYRSAY